VHHPKTNKQTQWPESASELYRPSDRRLLAKLVPTFTDKGCRVVSATDPHGRILGFLDRTVHHPPSQNAVATTILPLLLLACDPLIEFKKTACNNFPCCKSCTVNVKLRNISLCI
jgi:hypothetical protein